VPDANFFDDSEGGNGCNEEEDGERPTFHTENRAQWSGNMDEDEPFEFFQNNCDLEAKVCL